MGALYFAPYFIALLLVILIIFKVVGVKEIYFEGGENDESSCWRIGECTIAFLHKSENPYHISRWFDWVRNKRS
jgi:hypothetical protein